MGFPVVLLKATALHCTRSTVTADNAIPTELTTFHFVAEKLAVVHRDERVAEEGAEEIEERNDAVGVLKRHGGPSGDQLQQRHHGADGAERESEGHVYTKYIEIISFLSAYPVIILVVMEVIRCQRCLRKRALKAKLYRSLEREKRKRDIKSKHLLGLRTQL